MRFVQFQNPVTKEWTRVDRVTGRIVGQRTKPYDCPLFSESEKRKFRVRVTNLLFQPSPGGINESQRLHA